MNKDIFESGQFYHIYNRGNNKENIFIEGKNYGFFLTLLKKYILPKNIMNKKLQKLIDSNKIKKKLMKLKKP